MKKQYIYPFLFIIFIISIKAGCNQPTIEKPPYYFKCVINGVEKQYLINYAYYDANKNITIIRGRSDLYGEIEIVWDGTKISPGEISVNLNTYSEDTPHLWITDEVGGIDTFKTTNFKYQLTKYEDITGKISGGFSANITVNKLAYLKDTTRIDSLEFNFTDGYLYINSEIINVNVDTFEINDSLIVVHITNDTLSFSDTININWTTNLMYIEETVNYQVVRYRQVPEFVLNILKGEFSFYRSENTSE